MSRPDDSTDDHRRKNVSFRPLGDVCTVFNGFAFKSEMFNTQGEGMPLVRIRDVNTGYSDTFYSGGYDDRWVVEDGDILIGMDGDFRANRWRHGRALLNQRVCRLQDFSDAVIPDFIYYEVQSELDRIQSSITGSTVKHLSSRQLERSRIPVPPLEVQRKIVQSLDQLTGLEAELEAELNAELVARRRQYEAYRECLISAVEGPRVTLGEIGSFLRGRRFTKSDVVKSGIPSIHYGEIYTDYGVFASRAVREIDSALMARLRFAQPGDVIFAGVGETIADVGKAVAWLGDGPVAVHDDTFSFTSALNPKYLAYAVQTWDFHAQKANHVAQGKIKRLSMAGLATIRIPVPDLQEQARLASIFDRFDALVNELSVSLSAELAARRREYEHYRGELLGFEEVGAT